VVAQREAVGRALGEHLEGELRIADSARCIAPESASRFVHRKGKLRKAAKA
jgi:hypothetical protein